MDLNGDGKPDLVATARVVNKPNSDSTMLQVYGYGSGPTWKVYLNAP